MARCHSRCRKCRARRVLPKRPEHYATRPACSCGGLYVADKWMNERDTHATLCGCDGYHFQYHRVGSLQCKFNADRTYRGGDIETLPGIDLPF